MTLKRKILNISELTSDLIEAMFTLLEQYYANVQRKDFDRDLAEKNKVLLLFDSISTKLAGFSTQMHFTHKINERNISVVFSGDTIIAKEYWGSLELPLAFGEMMLEIKNENPHDQLFWMLITKGLRTYKFLPVFFLEYYPNYKNSPPLQIKTLMDELGYLKFPDSYDSSIGIIKAKECGQFLKTDYHPVKEPEKPYTRFFYDKNPGYIKGDELLCLAEFSLSNITPFIKRALKI
jgi:hypothetical protein